MSRQKIRIGIELNHVVRDINRQIVKYYQKDYDSSIDLDEVDYKSDVIEEVCNFDSDEDIVKFLYEDYPYEVFGCANTSTRLLNREINSFLKKIENQERFDIEVFFYSLREFDLTIQSTYFFLSKGTRVRKMIFPKNLDELSTYGDVFISADNKVVDYFSKKDDKMVILIQMGFNKKSERKASYSYPDLVSFLTDEDYLNVISKNKNNIECRRSKINGFLTWIPSLTSFLRKKIKM